MKIIGALLLSWVATSVVQAQPGNGPNLPEQNIHANDPVGVSVCGEPDLTRTVRVGDDGTIRLPLL